MEDLENLSKEELIQMLLDSNRKNEHLTSEIEFLKANTAQIIKGKDAEIEHLKEEIAKLRHQHYGSSSEKLDTLMENAINEPEELFDHSQPADLEEVSAADLNTHSNKLPKGKASKAGCHHSSSVKDKISEIVEEYHRFDEDFLKEHPNAVQVNPYTWEEIRHIKAKNILVRHIVDQYKLPDQVDDQGNEMIEKPKDAPSPLFPRSLASPGIIARVASQKYLMAIPLTRQASQFALDGIPLKKQLISGWLMRASNEYLSPLYDAMGAELKITHSMHGDETTYPCLECRREGGNKQNYIIQGTTGKWEEHQFTYFGFSATRAKEFVREIFGTANHDRILHSDAYKPYFLENFINIPCMDHIRRGFVKALQLRKAEIDEYTKIAATEKDPEIRQEKLKSWLEDDKHRTFRKLNTILSLMKKLYENERQYTEEKLIPDEIALRRKKEAAPIFDALTREIEPLVSSKVKKEVLAAEQGKKPSKNRKGKNNEPTSSGAPQTSTVGQAAGYYWRLKRYFPNFINEGEAVLSNARAENGMRPIAILRKNAYFFDTESGARCGCIYLTLLLSAKMNGLNPEAYLCYVLEIMKDSTYSQGLIESLLPYSKELPEWLKRDGSENKAS